MLVLIALIQGPPAAVSGTCENFLAARRVLLARRGILPCPATAAETTIITPRSALTAIIIAARWALWLRLR
jgi:hypothetical protein